MCRANASALTVVLITAYVNTSNPIHPAADDCGDLENKHPPRNPGGGVYVEYGGTLSPRPALGISFGGCNIDLTTRPGAIYSRVSLKGTSLMYKNNRPMKVRLKLLGPYRAFYYVPTK